jgi:hypothetical protein
LPIISSERVGESSENVTSSVTRRRIILRKSATVPVPADRAGVQLLTIRAPHPRVTGPDVAQINGEVKSKRSRAIRFKNMGKSSFECLVCSELFNRS